MKKKFVMLLLGICLFIITPLATEAASSVGIKNVGGELNGNHIWEGAINLVSDVTIKGRVELRDVNIVGNNFKIVNSGNLIVKGNAVLYDSSIQIVRGSISFEGGSLVVRSLTPILPSTPTISYYNEDYTVIRGYADPYATILISTLDKQLGWVTADDRGNFEFHVPQQKIDTLLSITALNSSGMESEEITLQVKSNLPPRSPIIQEINNSTVEIKGTAEINNIISVSDDLNVIATGRTDTQGNFSILIPKQITGKKLTITATNESGYSSAVVVVIVKEEIAYTKLPSRSDIKPDKIWTVNFTSLVDEKSITSNGVFVLDSNGNKQNVTLSTGNDKTSIIVHPPAKGYGRGQTYHLYINKDVVSAKGKKLVTPIELLFSIAR